ncbi:hypothetical protein [Streptomyces halobius]|uniref:Uncharacterized protein n=1 Tax=Streptomyces halobius TaxID=2879846 RepID=A0ABY4M6S9_9ACTN|nr:hypothetical protein [Streptomyces halobius]UQA93484.1 hypothetical protein K9S39_17970 [Streptomyces halobius]
MYAAARRPPHHQLLLRSVRPHAPEGRLRTALLRRWREAQRAAAMNVPVGTVKRGRA